MSAYAKVPEGTMGKKKHGRGSPTSPDVIGFSEECSHEFVEKKKTNSGGFYE